MCGVVIEDTVRIPEWVRDLKSFCRWADSDDYPEDGRISYLNGDVWVDMSKQQIFSHVDVKTEYHRVLRNLAKSEKLGRLLGDGVFLRHVLANFAHIPDGVFYAEESLRTGQLSLLQGTKRGFVEAEGTPDMTLEIVSDSSVNKDTVRLRELYWKAGIREYWLVDVRQDPIRFDILRHTEEGYRAARKQDGWIKSAVFGKSFKLIVETGADSHPEYTLAVR